MNQNIITQFPDIYNDMLFIIFFEKIVKHDTFIPQGGSPILVLELFNQILNKYFKKKKPTLNNYIFNDTILDIQQNKPIHNDTLYDNNLDNFFTNIIQITMFFYEDTKKINEIITLFKNKFKEKYLPEIKKIYKIYDPRNKLKLNINLPEVLKNTTIKITINSINISTIYTLSNTDGSNVSIGLYKGDQTDMIYDIIELINNITKILFKIDDTIKNMVSYNKEYKFYIILFYLIDYFNEQKKNKQKKLDSILSCFDSNHNIILNSFPGHVVAFYLNKIDEYSTELDNYEFYLINSNKKPTILKSKYTNKIDILKCLLTIISTNNLLSYDNINYLCGCIDNLTNINILVPLNIPFNNIIQQSGTCHFYSILLSFILFLYKNINNISYVLIDNTKEFELEKEYFKIKENCKYGNQNVPYIIQLIRYYIFELFTTISTIDYSDSLEQSNIDYILNHNYNLSYNIYKYNNLNEIYNSYAKFYDKYSDLPIFINKNNLISKQYFLSKITELYKKINKLIISIEIFQYNII